MDSLEYIDDYFRGEMLPENARQIEQRIEEDPAFAEEVAFYLSAMQAAKDQQATERKERFRSLYQDSESGGSIESRPVAPVRKMWAYYAAAAAVIAAFIIGGFLYFQQPSPQQMAEQFEEQHLRILGMSMGATEDSLETGKNLYNKGAFAEALRYFEPVAASSAVNVTAIELAGLSYYRMKQYDKSIFYFKQLESQTMFSNNGYFYHALALIRRNKPGDSDQARQLLQQVIDNNYGYRETAVKLMEKL